MGALHSFPLESDDQRRCIFCLADRVLFVALHCMTTRKNDICRILQCALVILAGVNGTPGRDPRRKSPNYPPAGHQPNYRPSARVPPTRRPAPVTRPTSFPEVIPTTPQRPPRPVTRPTTIPEVVPLTPQRPPRPVTRPATIPEVIPTTPRRPPSSPITRPVTRPTRRPDISPSTTSSSAGQTGNQPGVGATNQTSIDYNVRLPPAGHSANYAPQSYVPNYHPRYVH